MTLSRLLPDGSRAVRTEPVCFDFAIIDALGPDHWSATATSPGSAADAYAQRKRTHNDTEQRCIEAGYRFWPVVHEAQGATSKSADAAIRAITGALADNEGREPGAVRGELLARLAALVARTCARAVAKRARPKTPRCGAWPFSVAQAVRQDSAAAEED